MPLRVFPALIIAVAALAGCASTDRLASVKGPQVAHHQHLISPGFAALVQHDPLDAASLLRMMDDAGAERAVILSMGYSFADERKQLADPERKVRAENDWTAVQVAAAPERLRGFCSVNPLSPGALAEVERCNRLPGMKGLKLHFGNSGVDLHKADHVARMRAVFALANRLAVPVVVHLRARSGTPYGSVEARLFLNELVPLAPDVTIQIAHLAGSGPGHSADADAALLVFVEAIRDRDPRVRRLVFDVTTVASEEASPEERALVAARLRQLGMKRIVFGSDMPIAGNPDLARAWSLFRAKLPLTSAEFDQIAKNVAPYMRER